MTASQRRDLLGAGAALAAVAALSAVMVSDRRHLAVATAGLVLVLPVVAGVVLGGLLGGAVAVVAGFFAFDVLFIPPYDRLSAGTAANWVALVVYVIVMAIVARVVSALREAQAEALRHDEVTRQLYHLSDALIARQDLSELLGFVAEAIRGNFAARWVTVLLPDEGELRQVVTTGQPLTEPERAALSPAAGRPESLHRSDGSEHLVRLALSANGRPVGLVVLAGGELDAHDRDLLATFANQAALAIERAQLQEQVLRADLLEAVDRWQRALMGAVSHDLRTPLASVKAAVSTLRRPDLELGAADRAELLALIEQQSDRLARLVTNLLDMTRIEAGSLELRREATAVSDLVAEARLALGTTPGPGAVDTQLSADLPLVDVDPLVMVQVLTNLIDNALAHSPPGSPVEVRAAVVDARVVLSVRDRGPGVPAADRDRIFQLFNRRAGAGRAGLGLTIAKTFTEAHGQEIELRSPAGGGACFVVTMAIAAVPAEVA
jgi:two-component system, OmpR family, sensor histidine kinase KdpD